MITIKCDMISCSRELDRSNVKPVRILEKIYDFCPDCLTSLETFIKHRLNPGSDPETDLVNTFKKILGAPNTTQGVMLDYDYPSSTAGSSGGAGSGSTIIYKK